MSDNKRPKLTPEDVVDFVERVHESFATNEIQPELVERLRWWAGELAVRAIEAKRE